MTNIVDVTVRTTSDASGMSKAKADAAVQGKAAGESYSRAFADATRKMFSSRGGGSSGGGSALDKGVVGGAMPGIMGVSALKASIVGIGGAALGAVPALAALQVGVSVLSTGFSVLMNTNKNFAAGIKTSFGTMQKVFEQAVKPLAGPLLDGVKQLAGFIKSIGPELGKMFGAAAPLIQPLLKGIEGLVSGALPGLIAILKAARPAFSALADVLGTLGKGLGDMFKSFAPVIKESATIFKALGGVVAGLLPVIGKLAAIMASALAPIFVTLAHVIKGLEPVLIIIGNILASFAKAVLADLVGVLGSVGQLFKDISPALKIFAKALGEVFNTLENSGVFAVLGDALESIVPVLGKFISLLLKQLAPVLPILMKLISQFANILITLLAAGLTAILQGITLLLKHFPQLVPILAAVTAGWMALNAIMAINPFVAIGIAIVVLVGIVVKYHKQIFAFIVKTWDDVKKFVIKTWDAIMSFAKQWWPALLGVGGIVYKYHKDIWQFIQKIWHDVFNFLKGIWNDIYSAANTKFDNLRHNISNTFSNIRHDIASAWDAIWSNTVGRVERGVHDVDSRFSNMHSTEVAWMRRLRDDLSNAWNTIWNNTVGRVQRGVRDVGNAVDKIKKVFQDPINWVIKNVLDRLISGFDWISSRVGGPHINPIKLARGGKLGGYGGGDILPALLEPGETVVSKEHSRGLAGVFAAAGVPGYAAGGKAGNAAPGFHIPGGGLLHDIGGFFKGVLGWFSSGSTRLVKDILSKFMGHGAGGAVGDLSKLLTNVPATLLKDAVKTLFSAFASSSGSGSSIANFAKTFLGKIPYVWGGTSFNGDDCSGFTQEVYKHFGYNAPRTSEEQGSWVKKGAPTPGGLVFFDSPAGGPPPGHVGIVLNSRNMVSQAGPEGALGPTIGSIAGRMFAGVPPQGFSTGKGGPATSEQVKGWITAALAIDRTNTSWLGGMEELVSKESSGNPRAQNASGASGIAQMMPGTFREWEKSGYGNIWNAVDNLVSSIRYIHHQYGNVNNIPNLWNGNYGGYDSGGYLPTGLSMAYNGTGRPERVIGPNGAGVNVTLEIGGSGNADFDAFMLKWIKNSVRVKGGGNVQTAFGRH